ncbi:MAG TPA: polysaccharide deacetylase [Gammaproteobacteria bacterium]|nr:polysaccharide deacetylase [Gammaproteobacteria bacterium]
MHWLFVLLIFVFATAAKAEERQAVIFMYHHFGVEKYPSTNVRLEQFEAHLDYIADNGYQVWPLQKVVRYLRDDKPFPARVVAITIDDAYTSVYHEAFPRLRARGWPFTVFVATDGVDRRYKALMSWDQMREMRQHGASFANHSASHEHLIRRHAGENDAAWLARVREDIQRAQRRLTEELGEAPMLLAYPYGEFNTALADLVAGLGYTAFGQQSGPAGLGYDLRALPRYPMSERFADMDGFRTKIASLALPVLSAEPWEPVITAANNPPRLRVGLDDSKARLGQLACFVSGQGRVEVAWEDRQARRFAVQAKAPLPVGRSRYNCTAPSAQRGRYYWYSHLWIRLAAN